MVNSGGAVFASSTFSVPFSDLGGVTSTEAVFFLKVVVTMKKIRSMHKMSINGMTLISARRRWLGLNFIAGEPGRALGGDFFGIKLLEKKHGIFLEFHGQDIDLFSKEGEGEKHHDGGKDSEDGGVESFGDTC